MEPVNSKPYFTFRVSIRKNEQETILDTAVSGSTPEEVAKAKATVTRLIDAYSPFASIPAPLEPGMVMELEADDPDNQAPIDPLEHPAAATGKTPMEIIKARPKRKAIKGAIFLHCPECGRSFGTFIKDPTDAVECRCGHSIPLDNVARYAYDCPCCERRRFGWTNLEDPEIVQKCVCGNEVALTWNKSAKEYQS